MGKSEKEMKEVERTVLLYLPSFFFFPKFYPKLNFYCVFQSQGQVIQHTFWPFTLFTFK